MSIMIDISNDSIIFYIVEFFDSFMGVEFMNFIVLILIVKFLNVYKMVFMFRDLCLGIDL